MNPFIAGFFADVERWWAAGRALMPVMTAVALVLYVVVGERLVALFGPASRRGRRTDELENLMRSEHQGDGDIAWRAWIARYVAAAEEAELTRGFMVMRALTVCLPLLGLLGTVSGMSETFGAIGQGGHGSVTRAAGAGIGVALTTTQYGMALAIPAVVAEWFLRLRVTALVAHRELLSAGLVADPEPLTESLTGTRS